MATEAEILTPLVVALAVKRQEYEEKKTALRRQRDAWEESHQDEINAVSQARAHMPVLLSLDLRAYEKVLREVRASKLLSELIVMPGLLDEEPRATVGRD